MMEHELERIHEASKAKIQQMAEFKKFEIIKNRLNSIVALEKTATLNNKKLALFTEKEIKAVELEDLIQVEKDIKVALKRKENEK